MLKLLKFLVGLGCLGLFVWGGLTVPLGDRTLFQHIVAIGQSKESKDLVRGTRHKMSEVTRRLASDEAAKPPPSEAPPQEQLTRDDRQELRKLIETESGRAKMPR